MFRPTERQENKKKCLGLQKVEKIKTKEEEFKTKRPISLKAMKKRPKKLFDVDRSSDTSEEFDEPVFMDSDDDLDLETFSDLENSEEEKFKADDFVIVFYEGEFFPGQIIQKRENDEQTGQEYQVSVMAMSGPTGWRWPEVEDKIWYTEGQVLEKITPPSVTNSRGICSVPAIQKYRK